jgi:hypothetical protein
MPLGQESNPGPPKYLINSLVNYSTVPIGWLDRIKFSNHGHTRLIRIITHRDVTHVYRKEIGSSDLECHEVSHRLEVKMR